MLDWRKKDLLQEGPNGSTASGRPMSFYNTVLRSHGKTLEDGHESEGSTSAMIHCRWLWWEKLALPGRLQPIGGCRHFPEAPWILDRVTV